MRAGWQPGAHFHGQAPEAPALGHPTLIAPKDQQKAPLGLALREQGPPGPEIPSDSEGAEPDEGAERGAESLLLFGHFPLQNDSLGKHLKCQRRTNATGKFDHPSSFKQRNAAWSKVNVGEEGPGATVSIACRGGSAVTKGGLLGPHLGTQAWALRGWGGCAYLQAGAPSSPGTRAPPGAGGHLSPLQRC